MTNLYITNDLFFHNWNSADNGKLWFGIQAYIDNHEGGHLQNWVTSGAIFDGRNTQFRLMNPSMSRALNQRKLVPVPIPSDLPITVILKSGASVVWQKTLDRKEHCKVANPDRLRELNGFGKPPSDVEAAQNALINEAYPRFFASTVRDSITIALDENNRDSPRLDEHLLSANLVEKLELGQRQHYDPTVFKDPGEPFNATDPFTPKNVATNTHYLLGQLIEIDLEIARLKTITNIELKIGNSHLTDPDDIATKRIFSTIKDHFDPDGFDQSLEWNPSYASRINALPVGDTFRAHRLVSKNQYLWRLGRRSDAQANSSAPGNAVNWDQLQRVDIREKSEPANPIIDQHETLSFRPVITLDVKLVRYRNTPPVSQKDRFDPEKAPLEAMLVAIRPTASDKQRFDDLLKNAPGEFNKAKLFVINGEVREKGGDEGEGNKPKRVTANYEITPDSLKVYDFPWQSDLELIAFFNTGADEAVDKVPENAEYSFDDFIYQDAVLCIDQSESDTITVDRKGFEVKDMFGQRWEYWHDGKHESNARAFNGLLCDVLNDATIDADQLIISAFHNDRKDYELSQSARRLEGIATSSFKGIIETDPMDPSTFNFEQVLIEDKTNHNQMNIAERRQDFSLREGAPIKVERVDPDLRNVNSAIPAFQYEQKELGGLRVNLDYAYRVVMTDKTSAISNEADEFARAQLVKQNGSDAPSIRDFYYDVYQNIGRSRHIELNLEHTYGSTILPTSISGIPNPIDEPILLITDVGYSEYDKEARTSATQRFVTCELSNNGEQSEVTLQFNLDFLDQDWATEYHTPDEQNALNAARQLAHIQAWQSAAELYFTRNVDSTDSTTDGVIRLYAECYVFDVNTINAEHSAEALRDGLVKHEIAIPAANDLLYAWSKKVFMQALDPDQDGSITIPLDESIGDQYHCVRFRLELERSAIRIPSQESEWKVYERFLKLPNKPSEQDIDELFTMEGPKSDLLDFEERPAIAKQVEQFLLNLKLKGGYLYPKENEDTAAGRKDNIELQSGKSDKTQLEGIFALLGDGERAAHTEPCNNAWIIPEKTIKTSDKINVAYCPIGITPITNSPLLPNKASQTIRKYFEAMQAIIDFEPLDWYVKDQGQEVDAESLRNTIDGLVTQLKDNKYLKLIEAAQCKFLSLPDPQADKFALNDHVKMLSGESRNKAHAIGKKLNARIRQLLIEQPALFSSLKALGVLRVTGSEGTLSSSFYDIHLRRKIDELAPLKDALVDFRLLLQKDELGLTYLEQLDDVAFDNEFIFEALHGETVERVLEQERPGTTNRDYHIPLISDDPEDPDAPRLIHVPEPSPRDVKGATVRLPSRRPVTDPVMSAVRQMDKDKIDTEFPVIGSFQLDPFLQGVRTAAKGQPSESVVRFHSKLGELSMSIDDLDHVGVLTLFRITGDEEAPKQNDDTVEGNDNEQNSPSVQEISEQFKNDAFYLLVTDAPLSPPRKTDEQRSNQETTAFENLLKMLDSQTPYSLQEGLSETVLNQNNLSTITNIIATTPQVRSTPSKHIALAFTIKVDGTTGTDLKLVNLPGHNGDWDDRIRAQLYGNEKGDTFVWVETDMSIWEGKYVSMIQTRNQAISTDLQQAVFAPEFVTISDTVGGIAERTTQLHSKRADQTRPNITNIPMTIRTFVEAVLGDEIAFGGDEFSGAINRLNITIKQDASTFYPSNFDEVEVFNGTFAQQSLSIAPLPLDAPPENKELDWSSSDLILWFPELRSESRWRIDFEWRSPMNNDEILRIEDVPINVQQVTDGA